MYNFNIVNVRFYTTKVVITQPWVDIARCNLV